MQGLGAIHLRRGYSLSFIFKMPFFILGTLCLWMILAEASAGQNEEESYARDVTTDSMAVVLSADDIKKSHAEGESIREEDGLREEDNAANDTKIEKGQEGAKEVENPITENSPSENNATGDIQSTEKALEIRRQTQNIGSAESPTIDGGLISAPELVDTLEAGYRLENSGDVMDINSLETLFILSKLNSLFEENFFYNAAKLLCALREVSILYRESLSQNVKLIASAWFNEAMKTIYARNKITKSQVASHLKSARPKNRAKLHRGGAHG